MLFAPIILIYLFKMITFPSSSYSHPINQLYHPTGKWQPDSQELVYSSKILNTTKFTPILLKEWFYLVKNKGYLVIDYKPNKLCDWQKLEELMWWLWKSKYEIIFHAPIPTKNLKNINNTNLKRFINSIKNTDQSVTKNQISSSNPYLRFICQKMVSTTISNDSINKWTFGIITNGERLDWLKEIVDSIRQQKIPNYQIIICGQYPHNKKDKDILYIPFNQRNDKAWITKKKNLIAKQARYNNLCLIHDRVILDKNWYRGIKKWGNCFETISGKTSIPNKPNLDYACFEGLNNLNPKKMNYFYYFRSGNLQVEDWDQDVAGYSTSFIIKKNILINNPFNETLYRKKFEDIIMSQENNKKGYLIRMSPKINFHMKVQTIPFHYSYFTFNDQKLGKLNNESIIWKIVLKTLHFLKIPRDHFIINKLYFYLSKYLKKLI